MEGQSADYDYELDYPRKDVNSYKRRHEQNPAPVVTATFELGDDEVAAIEADFGKGCLTEKAVTVTKDYANHKLFVIGRPRWVPVLEEAVPVVNDIRERRSRRVRAPRAASQPAEARVVRPTRHSVFRAGDLATGAQGCRPSRRGRQPAWAAAGLRRSDRRGSRRARGATATRPRRSADDAALPVGAHAGQASARGGWGDAEAERGSELAPIEGGLRADPAELDQDVVAFDLDDRQQWYRWTLGQLDGCR